MEISAEKRSELPAERDVLEKKNAAHHIAELQLDSKFLLEKVAHGGLLVGKVGKKRYAEGRDAADDIRNRIHNSMGRWHFEDRSRVEIVEIGR